MIPASILLIILVGGTIISNVSLWMQFSVFKTRFQNDILDRLTKLERKA